jgi:hypothetical protein
MSEPGDSLLKIMGVIAAFVGTVCIRAWVLSILWAWFVVPIGVIALSVPHAIGFACVCQLILGTTTKPKEDEDFAGIVVMGILLALLSLGFGWIVKSFM